MTSVAATDVLDSPAADHRVYRLAAGTELLGEYQDSAYQEPKYLIQRVDGQTMQLPQLLYRVACSLDGRDAGQIAAEVNAELGMDITADQATFLVEERLRPVGVVAADGGGDRPDDAEPGAVPMPVRSDLLLALRYRAGVIPAGVAGRIGRFFQPLFGRPVWMVLVAAFLAVDAAIIAGGGLLDASVAGVQGVVERPVLILAMLGLTVVSGAFHEFGHVAACRYGGARPGDVGVGIYIVWPALYSDVTDSYRLDRVGRLRTDLGGIYFDTIFMAALGLVYLQTGEHWLLLTLIGMHVETAWQFLPSIRLDGYYILADIVGVPDLFGYVKPALLSVLPGRPVHPRVAELKTRARRLVVLWVLIVVPTLAFWLVLFLVAAPRILPAAWQSLQDYLHGLDAAIRSGDLVTTSLGVFQMFLLALPWVGSVLILWMLVDILGQKRRARGAGSRLSPSTRASLRRWTSLAVVSALGGLLLARVAAVAGSHPPTADETRLTGAAVAAVHGAQGPALGVGEWLAHGQLVAYTTLTGAFGRHDAAVTAARELAVVATAVLVCCFVALAVTGRLRPLAVALPLAAALAMGPAVTELATVGSAVLGAAWTALGALVLIQARRRPAVFFGVVAVTGGLATEPLLAVPVATCAAVMLLRGELQPYRPAWWPARAGGAVTGPAGSTEEPDRTTGEGGGTTGALHGRHSSPDAGQWDTGQWLVLALLALVAGFGEVLAAGRAGTPLNATERTVLVLVAAVVVMAALVSSRFRPPAVATAAMVLLATPPWPGAAAAAFLALVCVVLLAGLMIDAVLRTPVPHRAHPLLRGLVVVPAVVLVVVGALFQPGQATALPSEQLAAWITEPAAGRGTVAVPVVLWADLVRDGVPPERLARAGSAAAPAADWIVAVGDTTAAAASAARFGSGPAALTVVRSEQAEARERAAAERAAQAAAQLQAVEAEAAARRAFGAALAGNSRLGAPPEVLTALREGAVDSRVLAALASLTADHSVVVGAVPGTPHEDAAGVPRHQLVLLQVDRRAVTQPAVAARLDLWLAAVPVDHAPAHSSTVGDGRLISWNPPPAVPVPGQ